MSETAMTRENALHVMVESWRHAFPFYLGLLGMCGNCAEELYEPEEEWEEIRADIWGYYLHQAPAHEVALVQEAMAVLGLKDPAERDWDCSTE